MQQISARAEGGFHTYNAINTHDDDRISLDTITDWIVSAGHDLLRVPGHNQWYHRFKVKMENLPDEKRQNSCLSILGRFAAALPASGDKIASAAFAQAVRELSIGPEVPHLTERYTDKCVQDMERAGLVDTPAFVPAQMGVTLRLELHSPRRRICIV